MALLFKPKVYSHSTVLTSPRGVRYVLFFSAIAYMKIIKTVLEKCYA